MTTRAGEKHRQMAVSVGASGYIAKPVEERALIQEVRKWTGVEARAENNKVLPTCAVAGRMKDTYGASRTTGSHHLSGQAVRFLSR